MFAIVNRENHKYITQTHTETYTHCMFYAGYGGILL